VVSLRTELVDASRAIVELRGELATARDRIVELEARVNKNSRNSSKPPSSDGLAKPSPKSLRRQGVRRPGGQDGHQGATLAQVARPDVEVVHEPGPCSGCGCSLQGRPVTGVQRRQLFERGRLRSRNSLGYSAPMSHRNG